MIAMTEQAVWTVNKILQWTQQYFSGKGLETPRLDAEVLLCDVLGCRRIDLFMRLQQELSTEELKKYRSFVLRRAAWEPLAYITGHKTFLQWEFNVTPAVLIPRPETELLVEKAVHFVTGKSLTQLEKEAFWRKKAEEAKAAVDKVKTLSAEKLQDETDPEKAMAWQQEVADREAVALQAAERAGLVFGEPDEKKIPEPADDAEDPVRDKADQADHDQAGEDRIRCKISLGAEDHESETVACSDHLRNHKVGPCPSDRQPEIIDQSRQRGRKDHFLIDLKTIRAKRPGSIDHVGVHIGYRIHHHQHQLEEGSQENDRIFL